MVCTRFVVASLASLVLGIPSTVADAAPRPYELTGSGCVEPVFVGNVAVEQVAGHVPDGFTPISATAIQGRADVVFSVLRCDELRLDGVAMRGRMISDLGVSVASPDGSAGDHYYAVRQSTDSRPLRRAARRLGLNGALVDGLSAPVREIGVGAVVSGVAPSPDPYPFGFTAGVIGPLAIADFNTWWHRGPHGTVRIDNRFPGLAARAGAGTLQAPAGSATAQLLGMRAAPGLGVLVTFDLVARAARVSEPLR